MSNINNRKRSESGNVLFLILIAVALFAALSYVVTQSTRSGGGSTEREKNILSSAQMTQYPTQLRTAIIRMVLGGVNVENLRFDAPGSADFNSPSFRAQMVFHPQAGGATYQNAPAELSASGSLALPWFYNANFDVPGIGVDGSGGNEIIAFLPGVSSGVCKQVNEELGIAVGTCTLTGGVPNAAAAVTGALIQDQMDATYGTFPAGDSPDIQCNSGTAFTTQASGCFFVSPTVGNVFYSVLLER